MEALPYCFYTPEDVSQNRSLQELDRVCHYIKRMERKPSNSHMSGKEPIMDIEFLTAFDWETVIKEIFKELTHFALHSFSNRFVKSQEDTKD